MVQKLTRLGNQQPSTLTGEGSTTIRKEYTQVSGSAEQQNIADDIVWSAWKHAVG